MIDRILFCFLLWQELAPFEHDDSWSIFSCAILVSPPMFPFRFVKIGISHSRAGSLHLTRFENVTYKCVTETV